MKGFRKKSSLYQKSTAEKIVFAIAFVILGIWAISILYPLVWLMTNSLKDSWFYTIDLSKGLKLPTSGEWQFENYIEAFNELGVKTPTSIEPTRLFGLIFNSVWYAVLSLGIDMFFTSCTGYVLSKYKFRGRDFIYGTAIVCMTLPIIGTGGAWYTFYYQTGMYDTPWYVVFSSLSAFGTRFLLLYGCFKSISWEYAEAVFLDGGNDFTVFFRIMLPLAMPMIMTLSLMGFIGVWNAYEAFLIYMPSYPTLAVGLYKLGENYKDVGDWPVYYAAMIVAMVPVITVFIIFSDKIMTNVSIGGLKG